MPIKAADNNNNEKPINSIPMFNATNREYKIAVVTPVHSKNLLFIMKCYQKALGYTIWLIYISPVEFLQKTKLLNTLSASVAE